MWQLGKGNAASAPDPIELAQAEPSETEDSDDDDWDGVDGEWVETTEGVEILIDAPLDDAHGVANLSDHALPAIEPDGAALEILSPEGRNSSPNKLQHMLNYCADVSVVLRTSLLQAINSSLSNLPRGAFPMSASIFYTTYLLPSRPAHPVHATPIDIKHSTYKNLSAFLKICEKDGLVSLKNSRGDIMVSAVNKTHMEVLGQ